MRPLSRAIGAKLLLVLLVTVATAHSGKVLQFPTKNPFLTITFPTTWWILPEPTDGGFFRSAESPIQNPGMVVQIILFRPKKTRDAAEVMEQFRQIKVNGHNYFPFDKGAQWSSVKEFNINGMNWFHRSGSVKHIGWSGYACEYRSFVHRINRTLYCGIHVANESVPDQNARQNWSDFETIVRSAKPVEHRLGIWLPDRKIIDYMESEER